MFAHLRLLLSIFSFMAFTTDPGGKPNPNDPPEEGPGGEDDKKPKFTDEQNAEIGRIVSREVRKARDAARKELEDELDAKAKADAADAQRKADEEAGKFESVKQSLTEERDTAKSNLESAQSERDRALELLKANVDAQWDGLPDSVKKTYSGEEDDVLAKSAHMQQMKPIIDELAEKAETPKGGGNPPNPKVAGNEKPKVPSAVPRQRMW